MTRCLGWDSLVKAPHAGRQKGHQPSLGGGCRCSLAFACRFQSARLSLLTLLLYYRGEQLVSAAMGIVALTTNDVIGNTRSRPVSVLLRRLIQHIGTSEPSRRNPGLLATLLFTG